MFLSKTKRHTRFEKFVSTLIIVSMSFSFLLTGIPSKGGVRPNTGDSGVEKAEAVELGKIAFNSDRDGNYEIYVMNADGSNQTRLTNNPAADSDPDLSPDGSKITFRSNRSGNLSIYVMNADGSGTTQLTSGNTEGDFDPTWSPDGTKIAFARGVSNGKSEIYVMNSDGSSLTDLTNNGLLNNAPTWSPDGNKIAFTQAVGLGSDSEIYVMNSNGSAQTNLTNYPGLLESYASWSPDGIKIAFSRYGGGNFSDIFTMNPDGNGQTNLTNSSSSDDSGSTWSPDGTKIAFLSNISEPANGDIYVMNADGSSVTRITSNPANDSGPDWGPGSVPPPDETPPVLVNSTPSNDATGVQVNLSNYGIGLNFSEQIVSADATALGTKIKFKKSDGTYLNGMLSNFSNVSGNNYKVDMSGGNLEYDTTYIVEISGFKDASNNTMAPITVTFTTESAGPPPPSDTLGPSTFIAVPQENDSVTGVVNIGSDISDIGLGDSPIQGAEYFIDTPGANGEGVQMTAFDSLFDMSWEMADGTWDSTSVYDGSHTIYVHGKDAAGNWGDFFQRTVNVNNGSPPLSDTTGPTTFIGTPAPYQPISGPNVNIGAQIDDTGSGNSAIAAAEYFITPSGGVPSADGTGVPLSAGDGTFDGSWEGAFATWNSTTAPNGINVIHVHGKDASGNWGEFATVPVDVENGQQTSQPYLEAMIDHNWIKGRNFPPNENITVMVNGPEVQYLYIQTDNDGNFWLVGWENGFNINRGSVIDVYSSAGFNNMVVQNITATADADANTISGTAATPDYTPLAGKQVDVSIKSDWGAESELAHGQAVVSPDATFNIDLNPFDLVIGNKIFLTVTDDQGNQTHIAPYNESPILDANITGNWIGGSYFPSYENVTIAINGGEKGTFELQTDGEGSYWLDGWENWIQVERGDAIDVTYSGGTVSMIVQNLNAAADVDANTVSGTAFDKFDTPLEGYMAIVQILNSQDDSELASLETTVGTDGSFTADFSQLPFDLQTGQKVIVDLFGGGIGHSTLLEPYNAPPIQILNMYPQDGSTIGLQAWFDTSGSGEWQNVDYEYSGDGGQTWNQIGTDYWPWVDWYEQPYSYSYMDWYTEGLPEGTYQIRVTAYDWSGNSNSKTQTYNINLPPQPPKDVDAVSFDDKVVLSWFPSQVRPDAPTSDAIESYEIYRSLESGNYWHDEWIEDPYGMPGDGWWDWVHNNPIAIINTNEVSPDANGRYSVEDYNVSPDATYYYVVRAKDASGERSVYSNEARGNIAPDYMNPAILNMYPEDGSKIGLWAWFDVSGTDDVGVRKMVYEYSTDGFNWLPIGTDSWAYNWYDDWEGQNYFSSYFEWNTEGMEEGNYTIRATAYDYRDNTDSISRSYLLDKTGSTPVNLSATPGEGRVTLNWNASTSQDTERYIIYRSPRVPSEDVYWDYSDIPSEDALWNYLSNYPPDDYNYPSPDAYPAYWAYEKWFYPIEQVWSWENEGGIYTFNDYAVSQDATYYYFIRGVDDVSNVGDPSNEAFASPYPDEIVPEVLEIRPDSNRIGLRAWLEAFGTDNAAWTKVVFEYKVDNPASPDAVWNYIGTDNWPYFSDQWDWNEETQEEIYLGKLWSGGVDWYAYDLPEGNYTIRATAYDYAGHSASLERSYFLDKIPPARITDLTATPGDGNIRLDWSVPSSDSISGYTVYRSTQPIPTPDAYGNYPSPDAYGNYPSPDAYGNYPSPDALADYFYATTNTNTFNDVYVSGDATYYYVVTAVDDAGNENLPSNQVNAQALSDVTPPTVINIMPYGKDGIKVGAWGWMNAIGNDNSAWRSVLFEYSADNGDTWNYIGQDDWPWYDNWSDPQNPVFVGWTDWYEYESLGTLEEGNYLIRATAYDYWNNSGSLTKEFYLDKTPPDAPTNLTAEPGNGFVDLNWIPSISGDTAWYNIYKSTEPGYGQFGWFVASVDASTIYYRDNDVYPDVSYFYTVTATDDVNNQSGPSNEASAQTEIGPSATVSGQVLSGGQPVPNATVYAYPDWGSTDGNYYPWIPGVTTNINGEFSFQLPVKNQGVQYWLSADWYDNNLNQWMYAPAKLTQPLNENDAITDFNLSAGIPAPMITNPQYGETVYTSMVLIEGNASPNANIEIKHYDTNWNLTGTYLTNANPLDGTFDFSTTPINGHNYLLVTQQLGEDISSPAWVYFYSNAIADPATISGKVLSSEGTPVADATVNIGGSWQTNYFSSSTTTDVSGAYSFTVPSGEGFVYWLDAYKYDPVTGESFGNINYPYVPVDTPGTYQADDLQFNFGPPTVTKPDMDALVKSSIVGVIGQGVPDATINVTIYSYDNNWYYYGFDNTQFGTANGAGNFDFDVTLPISGHHYLYISQTKDVYTSESVYRHLTANFADDLTNNAIISGTVTQGGNPVEDANVYVWQNYYGGNYVGYIPPDTTDPNGDYSIPVPKGASYSIYTYDNLGNYSSTKIVPATGTTVAGQTYDVDMSFKPNPPTIDAPTNGDTVDTSPTTISGTADVGATVKLNIESYDANWNWNSTTYTVDASDGTWSQDVPVNNGYIYISASQEIGGEESYLTYSYFYVQLAADSATISGKVLSAGQGVNDATVYVYGSWPSYFSKNVQANSNGDYTAIVEGNTTYWIYAYKYDTNTGTYLYSSWEQISVTTGNTPKDITMKPPAPKVTSPTYGSNVTDSSTTVSGKASPNLPVTVKVYGYTSSGTYNEDTYNTNADVNGNFSKSGVIVYNGYNTVYAYQSDSGIDSDWTYHYYYGQLAVSSGTLTGIVSQNGSPIEGATVYAYANNNWWNAYSATSNSNGTYTLKLPAGSQYYVYAYKGDSYSSYYDVPSSGTVADGGSYTQNIGLPPSAPSVVSPTDATTYSEVDGKLTANGTSLANAGITITQYSYNIYGYYVPDTYSTTADSSGNWSTEIDVNNGDNYLYVSQTDTLGNTSSQTYVGFYVKDAPQSFTQQGTLSGKVTKYNKVTQQNEPVEGATVLAYTYSTNFTAETDANGNYTIQLPATGGWGTYLTAYSYITADGKYGSAPAQSFWVTDDSNTNADFKLAFAESLNSILSTNWNYREGKIDYRMVFGASPGIDNLDQSSTNLEISVGSDEYYAQDPNLSGWASGIIRTFDSGGTINWIKSTDNDEARSSVAIADTDSDGKLEVALGTTSGSQIQLWSNAGVKKWTKGTGGFVHSSPAIADLVPTKTGSEIIGGSYSGSVYVQDKDGNDIWSYNTGSSIVSSPSVGDIDGDGKREVVVGSTNNKVYVLSNSGSKLYEYTTGGEINSSPARADLNKDGKDEIIIGSNDGNVYALSIPASGTTLTKLWSYKTGGAVYSSPSIADIDKNGNLDVVVGSNDNNIYALTSKGALKWKYMTNGAVYSSAAIADRGNDSVGIYIGSEDGSLYMLEGNGANAGKIIDRFDTGALIRTSPAVADTDGDGKLDIFFSDWRSGGDLFWSLEDNTSSVSAHSKQWPQFGYNAAHRRAKLDLTTNVAPAAPVITTPDPSTTKYSNSNAQTISGTNITGATVELFDGSTPLGNANVTDTAWTKDVSLSEGTHNITAKAKKDTLVSDSSSTLKIVIDTTNPSITVTGVAQSQSYSSGVKANYSASDASPVTPTATLSKDGGAANPYTSGTPISDAGSYQLIVSATDSANNPSTKTVNFTVTATDTTPPTVNFVDPTSLNDSVVYNPTQTIKATLSDAGSGIKTDTVVIRRTIPSQETIPIEIVSLSLVSSQPITVTQGSNAFEVEAKDNSGNTTIKTVKFYYSANQPSMMITPTTAIDPGDKTTLTGLNFSANDIVKITRFKADGSEVYVGSATTNGSGAFTYDYITPASISAGERVFKAVGSYNTSATASVNVKLDFMPESGSSFKQANQTIYVNGGEAASSMTMSYVTEPDNGAPAVNMTPVSKENSTTWHYGTLPGSIMPKGSYKVVATARKSDGSLLASSPAIYHISEKDLSLEFVPQSGSTVTKSTTTTFKALAGNEVQSVAFSYSTDGGANYSLIGTDTEKNADSFFDVFFDITLTDVDTIKVKAVPNNEENKAVIANYILKSPTSVTIYPTDGSIINDNPKLAAKASTDVEKVRFDRFNTATSNWDPIGEDTTKDSAGWFDTNLDTSTTNDGEKVKVRAVPDIGAGYNELKAAVATYTLDKDLTLTLVHPNDNSTVENNPFIWVKSGDGVTSVKAEISIDNAPYADVTSSTDEGAPLNESIMLKYPNTNQWYLHLYTLGLGSSTDFNLRLTPNNSTNPNDILVLSYTTPAAENLGVTLFPNDGSTIGKDATLTAVGESSVQSVEFFYSSYDGSTWSEPEPLPTSTGSNTVAKGDDQFFRVEINSDEIVDGQIKVTANSYNTGKSNGSSDTNDYTHDTTAPNKPKTVTVTYAEGQDEGINVHWADPKNQATDVAGYNVYRQKDSAISSIDGLTPVAFVQYDGTDSSYFYLDHEAPVIKGTFHYAVTAVDNSGNESEHKQGNKSIKMDSPVPENEGESQLILPSEGDDDKELYAVGQSPVTDAFELAIEGDEVNNPTIVDLDPINDNSADTYSENEILNYIEGQEDDDMQLGGSIFDITSTTTQDDQVVNQLNSAANTGDTEAGASMTIAYDESTSNTPDNYADKLENYNEENNEYKASNDSGITQYSYSELWRYGSKLKKVTGQTKTGNKIFSKVRRFSAYMVMFLNSPSVDISGIDNDGKYNTSKAPSVSISAGANPIASKYILLKKNGATESYNTTDTELNLPITTAGTYYLEASATDDSNETTTIYSNFTIDKNKPTTTKVLSKLANSLGWNNTSVTLTLNATDNAGGVGVGKRYYRIGTSGVYTEYTAPVSITTEGTKTIYYYSKDLAGNEEIPKSFEVKIDKSKPRALSYSTSLSSVRRGKYIGLKYKATDTYSPKVYVTVKVINPKGKTILNKALGAKSKSTAYSYPYKIPSTAVIGTNKYIVILKDYAGNILTTSAKYFKVAK